MNGPDRDFPTEHVFGTSWLLTNAAVASLEGDDLTLELANARATYHVEEVGDGGVRATLVDFEVFDAPPVEREEG